MPKRVFAHVANKTIRVVPTSVNAAAGETLVGTIDHEDAGASDSYGYKGSHVLYHHVEELMIKAGLHDYAAYTISNTIANTGVNAGPNFTLAIAATRQLTPTVLPEDSTDARTVTYASATPAVATVSAEGLVTAVAQGTSVITVTTTVGGFTDTLTVTVPAP